MKEHKRESEAAQKGKRQGKRKGEDDEEEDEEEDEDPELKVPFADIEVHLSEDGSMQTLFQAIQNMSDSYRATMATVAAAADDAANASSTGTGARRGQGWGGSGRGRLRTAAKAEPKSKRVAVKVGESLTSDSATDEADDATKAVPWKSQYTLDYSIVVDTSSTGGHRGGSRGTLGLRRNLHVLIELLKLFMNSNLKIETSKILQFIFHVLT